MKKYRVFIITAAAFLGIAGMMLIAAPAGERAPAPGGAVRPPVVVPDGYETAVFAGGCFWSIENAFEKTLGVYEAVSGYTGGKTDNPTYESYSRNGHLEAVLVVYDPELTNYSRLLDVFWRNIDPTDDGGQFVDRGPGYRTAIFWSTEEERRTAEASKAELDRSGRFQAAIRTGIRKTTPFFPAEANHQDFAKNNPEHYGYYNAGSGRPGFFSRYWGTEAATAHTDAVRSFEGYIKPSRTELRTNLSSLSFDVTQEEGTEPPYDNEFWDNHEAGIYVDIVSGEPLFSSTDKYDSGTGWPSFTRPLLNSGIVQKTDTSYGMTRIEVRSRYADSHLGHLFHDGPAPGGLRYCINSAALRFIPEKGLEREGYGEFRVLFGNG